MILPYDEPLIVREPGDRVIPEPPRRGEPGGEPCGICTKQATAAVWSDPRWTLHPPVGGSLPGAVWLASRVHADSFSDLPKRSRRDLRSGRPPVWNARSSASGRRPVHLYRWGDGGAHFHVWFLPRPLGMLEATGMMLPLWEDVLPNVPDEELAAAAERVAAAM